MSLPLKNKVAVVTGGRQGLGYGVAEALAADGATVVIADVEPADDAVLALQAASGRAHASRALDVRSGTQFEDLVRSVAEEHGTLDILVNNAGVSQPQVPITETTDETFQRVVSINLEGAFYGVRAAGRLMSEQGFGRIINIASYLGRRGMATFGVYSASKAAVIGLTQAAAEELGPAGVTVNAICPGTMWTQLMLSTLPATTGEANPDPVKFRREYAEAHIPVRRLGLPIDVGALAAWLASDNSAFMTGATLNLTGGEAVYF
ncbi:SDR family NAD(P)-dependent oxidoreductase [Arthrobacter sp. KNU-44]|uniref:SDR family NAD(P)-dependent oxidoreductase n=1 Tax=Arthrobacter sp. KNU-44 TaxID=3450744 RepID=UPI003F443C1E